MRKLQASGAGRCKLRLRCRSGRILPAISLPAGCRCRSCRSGNNRYVIEEMTAMPLTHNALIDQLLIPALFLFLLVAGIAGAALGAALIVFRGRVLHLFGPMNRWVSARRTLAPLETVHNVDPAVYRYRRWFSAVFIVGAAFSMIMLIGKLDVAAVVSLFGGHRFSFVGPWLVESLEWTLLLGSVLAIVVGVILGFFPRMLGVLEMRANRWYSPRRIGKGADEMVLTLDRWVEYSPRIAGWIISVAAVIVAVNSAVVLIGLR
jgi:hypothetical protein